MTVYAGLDVSKDETAICSRDESGHILWEGKAASNGDALWTALAPYAGALCMLDKAVERTPHLHQAAALGGMHIGDGARQSTMSDKARTISYGMAPCATLRP